MAYTKTLISDVREHGFTDYDSEKLQTVVEVANTNFTNIEQAMTDIAVEGTADAVGAMVTGNTEVGIAVVYQDGDNTLDFTVAYGSEAPGDVGASTAAVGETNAAARADHSHNLASHTHDVDDVDFDEAVLSAIGVEVPEDGAGCTIDITADGTITAAVVNAGGGGYKVNDILDVTGGNSDGKVTVATVDGGAVLTVTITAAGTGYSTATGVTTTTTSTRSWTATNMAGLSAASAVTAAFQAVNDDILGHDHDSDYQETLNATTTLGDLGLPAPDPAYSGILTGITTASTLAQLLAAIDSHTHGG